MIDLSLNVDEVLPAVEACEDRDALEAALSAARRVTVRRAIEDRLAALPLDVEEAPAEVAPEPEPEPEPMPWPELRGHMALLRKACALLSAPVPNRDADPEAYASVAEQARAIADTAEAIAAVQRG